jgi:YggT family protein
MSLGRFVSSFIYVYEMCLFAYVLLSWFAGGSSAVRGIYDALAVICEPYLAIFRRFMPPVSMGGGAMDFSPIVAIFVLQIVSNLAARLL